MMIMQIIIVKMVLNKVLNKTSKKKLTLNASNTNKTK